jgi:MFS family permease
VDRIRQIRLPDAGLNEERRHILVWMCVLIAVNQFGFGTIVPVIALYAESFGVGETAIGLAIGVYGLARFGVNMPAGRFADRRGRRPLLALGGVVTTIGNILCAVAPNYPLFLLARFVAGAGAAMVLTGGTAVMADISRANNRGRVMAIYQGVFLFAVGIGPFPGGLLATHLGLPAPFVANALLAGGVAVLAWYRVPETWGLRESAGVARPRLAMIEQLRLLVAIPGFGLIGLVSFSVFFARTGGLFNVVPLIAKNRLHLTPDQIGVGLGLVSVVGLTLAYPSGALVDRFGRKAVIVPATLLNSVAMVLFAIVAEWRWFLFACLTWAISTGISGAAPAAYAADVAPPGITAAALGAYRMLADAGYVAGPVLLGLTADLVSPPAALVVAALLTVVTGFAFALGAPETLPAKDPPPQPPVERGAIRRADAP